MSVRITIAFSFFFFRYFFVRKLTNIKRNRTYNLEIEKSLKVTNLTFATVETVEYRRNFRAVIFLL